MGNSTFIKIEKKYGSDGIDYVTFRHHERKWYKNIREKINQIKDKAADQQQRALDVIIKEKRKLQKDFQQAKKQAQNEKQGCIKKTQIKLKKKVEEFSGFNEEWNRLDNIYKDVNSRYEAEKAAVQKKIREDVMRKQNKSKLKFIKEFDDRSDHTRKIIEDQCIKKYPEKAEFPEAEHIPENITWEKHCTNFDSIFEEQSFFVQAEAARYKVRNGIITGSKFFCC